jgi:hypothetical protein
MCKCKKCQKNERKKVYDEIQYSDAKSFSEPGHSEPGQEGQEVKNAIYTIDSETPEPKEDVDIGQQIAERIANRAELLKYLKLNKSDIDDSTYQWGKKLVMRDLKKAFCEQKRC